MIIQTSRFGEIEIDSASVISFKKGLPGFPEDRAYTLLPHREDSPFLWLQSIDSPELAFLVINPFEICRDYSYEIPNAVRKELGIKDVADVQTLAIVTIRNMDNSPSVTVNLLGPLVVNARTMSGTQIVLDPKHYDVQYKI